MADERSRQQLINRRTTLIAALGRAEQFVEKYVAERDSGQVKLRLESLDTVWMGLEDVQTQLEDLELTNQGMAQNLAFRSHNETRYFQIKASLQSYLPNVPPSTNAILQSSPSGLSGIKLPTISLPEFDGDYNNWLAFHDTFVALIHSNPDVHDIQKFHYLRAALKGEAAQLIESIGISSANYPIAWQTLVSRYANEYLLKKRHLQALLDCPRMKKESAAALHSVVDEYERHTKTLRQLGYHPLETEQSSTTVRPSTYTPKPIVKQDAAPNRRPPTSTNAVSEQTSNSSQTSNANVLLSTVVLMVLDCNGQAHPARALLDNGSQSNIISDRLCQLLRLKRNKINIPVFGVGESSSSVNHSVSATIRSRTSDFEIGLDFLVMPRITIDLPVVSSPSNDWHAPQDLPLADPTFNKTGAIDMLLGAEHFFTYVNPGTRIVEGENPILIKSVFGWIVTGRNQTPLKSPPEACHVSLSDPLHEAMERFWLLEEVENRPNYSVEEQQCESHYISNVSRTPEGRYIVRLPRHPNFDHMLGESKSAALRRFYSLERRLSREPHLMEEYHSFLSEYLSLGHMRVVPPSEEEPQQVHYLPHHAVLKEASTTTKDELLTLVLRFRKYPIALVADIAKMYRQVLLHPDDTPLQRILWRFHPDDPVTTYELSTVTYGLAPSSFLATRTLQQLAADEGDAYPHGAPALKKGFYVDDYIGGADTEEKAIETREELDELLAKGGFQLRKWASNSEKVLEGLDPSRIVTQPTMKFDHEEPIKALGICWEPRTDLLRFDSAPTVGNGPPTKRSILSAVSKHFDPLGLTAPVIIRAKMLLQELWLQPCGWDEEVSDTIQDKWNSYCTDLPKIVSYRVERYAFLPNSYVQLHTFADASQQAYGACIYARSTDVEGAVKVRLIASKSKVAPLKRVSIPRLELSAAVLAARLHKRVSEALDMPITASHFWSDSTVTLEWLRSPPYTWSTFVANRVSEIQTTTQGSYWHHIAGRENPADLVSRGMTVEKFLSSNLWHHGPAWLTAPETEWPINTQQQKTPEEILERRRMVAAVQNKPEVNGMFDTSLCYNRLTRVTAYCLRFIQACRSGRRRTTSSPCPEFDVITNAITVEEMSAARMKLIKLAQADVFAEEIRYLGKGKAVSKHSSLRLLSPFIDDSGILRVGGRLRLSDQPYITKHPILLPNSHPLTRSIAMHYHLRLLHGGGRVTLAAIRQEFWPIQGRRLVNHIRITPSRPFSVTGVDFAGPVYMKAIHKRASPTKAYISVFVCFVTKAVHLELVSDLSTPAFLNALRRFIARRGCPTHIHSDNGKNFEGARNALHELYQMLQREKASGFIATHCSSQGIQWHMTPPKAPHFGGLWEAAVKVAKKHMYRQLGNAKLSFVP
ncbi:uncharacterized protein LOC134289857 [Aedes albopictus]|uniref:Integrase catalytic domain-containing protein n=1 Tax=Aedes albopictus TaxID=7160 RepID=A0ABM1Y493_AEDAL